MIAPVFPSVIKYMYIFYFTYTIQNILVLMYSLKISLPVLYVKWMDIKRLPGVIWNLELFTFIHIHTLVGGVDGMGAWSTDRLRDWAVWKLVHPVCRYRAIGQSVVLVVWPSTQELHGYEAMQCHLSDPFVNWK